MLILCCLSFFFNDTATTEIYTLSLHDALPISSGLERSGVLQELQLQPHLPGWSEGPGINLNYRSPPQDRKSTRLNSSHANISYAVFCLKKKKKNKKNKDMKTFVILNSKDNSIH